MTGKRAKGITAGIGRRAFLLWNAVTAAGVLVSPLFGRLLRPPSKDVPAGREGKYYRKLEGGK